MTNKEILQADILDILFEHRNKTYGAYALRREYNHRLRIALGVALSIVLLVILSSFFRKGKNDNNNFAGINGCVQIKTVDLLPDQPEEKEKIKEKRKQVHSSDEIIITKDETNVRTQEEIKIADVGTEDIEGDEPEDPNRNQNNSDANSNESDKNKPESAEPDFKAGPTAHASFPGGETAWLNFLRRYLQTPDDLEPGQRIEVRVRFWVDTDGSVSRFEIIQSGGSSFDKEVLRVMKKMPRWEPALQNGNKVSTSFTQPVIFMGIEE